MSALTLGTRGHWIGGREVAGPTFDVFDPGNGELLGRAARGGAPEADAAVRSASEAFHGPWSDLDGRDRVKLLWNLARLLDRDRVRLGRILALENGKPLALADHEVQTAIRYCEYYAGWADKIAGRQIAVPGKHFAYTLREPLGVILLITPWNYPLDILLRGLAPALAAGNTVVAKPAEDTPFIALEVGALMAEAGFPDGVFNVVTGFGAEAGAALTAHPGLQGISFCGSAATGSAVAAQAAGHLVPVLSLELGGKCPSLVLPDGDVEAATRTIAGGLIYNAGQSCVARSRLLVPRRTLPRVEAILSASLAGVTLGHCLTNPAMGPLINRRQWEKVGAAVDAALEEGARPLATGSVPPGLPPGHFFAPRAFEVTPQMTLARDEVFGPVLAVVPYDDEDEGIALANDTEYGLAAELWTGTPARAHGVVRRLNASHITVNGSGGFGLEVPFGGIGKSGYGREGGEEGLWQYTRVKSIYMSIE